MDTTAPPVPAIPIIPTPVPSPTPPAKPPTAVPGPQGPSKKWIKIVAIILAVVLVIVISSLGAALAIAYEAISINNPRIEKPITQFVLSLPFTPKTPEFLVDSVIISTNNIKKSSFNFSLNVKSKNLNEFLGSDNFTGSIIGKADSTDINNPQGEFQLLISPHLDLSIKQKDKMVYLKANKIPDYVVEMYQLDKSKMDELLKDWVGIDISEMMRKTREQLVKYFSQKQVQKFITHEATQVDNFPTYKLRFSPDDKTLDNFIYTLIGIEEEKTYVPKAGDLVPSEVMKNFVLDIWIDEKDYYMRKINITFDVEPPKDLVPPSQVLGVSIRNEKVLGETFPSKLDNFKINISTNIYDINKDFNVEAPKEWLTPEEFTKKIEGVSGFFEQNKALMSQSHDAVRISDLANLTQVLNILGIEAGENKAQALCNNQNILRPCFGSSFVDTQSADGSGWIKANLVNQKAVSIPILPKDPVNDPTFHYVYCSYKGDWELNAVLTSEEYKPRMISDRGDDPNKYEMGTNLNLVNKVPGCSY